MVSMVLLWALAGWTGTRVLDDLSWPLAALTGIGVAMAVAYPLYALLFRIGVWFGERDFGRTAALLTLLSLIVFRVLPPFSFIEVPRIRGLGNLAWACHVADWRRLRAVAAQSQQRRALRLAARDRRHMLLLAQAFATEAGRLTDRGWFVAALEMAEMADEAYAHAAAAGNPADGSELYQLERTISYARRYAG